jgi:hypothetical protein
MVVREVARANSKSWLPCVGAGQVSPSRPGGACEGVVRGLS